MWMREGPRGQLQNLWPSCWPRPPAALFICAFPSSFSGSGMQLSETVPVAQAWNHLLEQVPRPRTLDSQDKAKETNNSPICAPRGKASDELVSWF